MSEFDIYDRTFSFACRVVKLCQIIERKRTVNRSVVGQLLRAGTSVGANLAEGKGAQSRADFIHKVTMSTKEAHETYYWLRIIAACEIENGAELQSLLGEANELIAVLTAIARNAKRNAE